MFLLLKIIFSIKLVVKQYRAVDGIVINVVLQKEVTFYEFDFKTSELDKTVEVPKSCI